MSLHKIGMLRMTMGGETNPHHPTEKNNFLNEWDEVFGFLCTHISWDILFHLEGLNTPKEYQENLEFLFGKQFQGYIL